MSFPGLLFLLLVSSCLPVSSTPPSSRHEGEPQIELDESKPMFKKFVSWLKKHHRTVAEVLSIYFPDVPLPGILSKTVKLLPHEHSVDSNLRDLNVKLNIFHEEMKWDAWAAAAYQTPVNNIENAWNKYTELVHSANTEKEALRKAFFAFYSQYEDSTLLLHQFLTAKPSSIAQNFGDLLAHRLRCHEKDIEAQFLYLNELMCKGNILNERYHEFKGTKTNAVISAAREIASQSASALFTSHKQCIADSTAYLKMDIFERIDDTKKHDEIENSIKAFLEKTYHRFDWLVVAFTTHYSRHLPKIVKRHDVSGFIQVERGTVTVAVAKQAKGSHTLTAAVGKAIATCMQSKTIFCLDVAEILRTCQEKVFGKRLSQTYTAVHVFKKKRSQPSSSGVEAQEGEDEDFAIPESSANFQDSPSLAPYLFVGKCGKALGNFMVLVKSDEEIKGEDLCTKVKCQHDGKCVVVSGTFIAMCECKYPYYGDHCEMSLDSYERQLKQDTEDRTRTRAQSSGPKPGRLQKRKPKKSKKRRQKGKPKKSKKRGQKGKPKKSKKKRPQKGKPQSKKRRPKKRKPKSTKLRLQKGKPQTAQSRPTNDGSSTSVQLSSVKGKDIKSFCGSLCDDKTIKSPIL